MHPTANPRHLFATLLLAGLLLGSPGWAGEAGLGDPSTLGGSRAPRSAAARYGSLPKGVTLEGTAMGFAQIKSIHYTRETDLFTINSDTFYRAPIPMKELKELIKILLEDDRIGVSLVGEDGRIVYGKVPKNAVMANRLVETDRFLGGVTFADEKDYREIPLPGGYKPQKPKERTINTAVHFNLTSFAFQAREIPERELLAARTEEQKGAKKLPPPAEPTSQPGEGNKTVRAYCLVRCELEATLWPLSKEKAPDGGHLPDTEAMKLGKLEKEDQANVEHIKEHMEAYLKIGVVAPAVRYGEAAAFIRFLRDSGIDINPLLKQLN